MRVLDASLRAVGCALVIGGLAAAVVQAREAPVKEVPISAAADAGGVPVLRQGTAHEALFGVAFDGDRGLAVGAMGEVQQTTDGGRSWQGLAQKPTPLSLLGVGLRGERGVAVGQLGVIVTGDNGVWSKADSGTTNRLFAVGLNASGLMAAVGAFGTVTLSRDGGKRWAPTTIDWSQFAKDGIEPHLYDVVVADDGVVTIAGENGLILRSANGGQSWAAVHQGEASLFDLSIRGDGVGFAVGQDGVVLNTQDGGKSWKPVPTSSKSVLLGVWSAPDGHVLIAGMHQTLESRDGGNSWSLRSDGDFATGWYSSVAASASGGLILVGNTGRIVKVDG